MNQTPSLPDLIRDRLASGDVELPVFDSIAIQIHREARESRLDADGICRLLEQDATLVSEVLRMANSSFFSGLTEVRSLRDACVRLGVRQIAAIVFSISAKRLYSASKGRFRARLLGLWQHASAVSMAARWIALRAGHPALGDEAFVAGLLHDIGKLSLLRIIERIASDAAPVLDDELVDATLASMQIEHGAWLLGTWNVPSLYREVLLHLEDQPSEEDLPLLSIVRLADKACALEGLSDVPAADLLLVQQPEPALLGMGEADLDDLSAMLQELGSHQDERRAA